MPRDTASCFNKNLNLHLAWSVWLSSRLLSMCGWRLRVLGFIGLDEGFRLITCLSERFGRWSQFFLLIGNCLSTLDLGLSNGRLQQDYKGHVLTMHDWNMNHVRFLQTRNLKPHALKTFCPNPSTLHHHTARELEVWQCQI